MARTIGSNGPKTMEAIRKAGKTTIYYLKPEEQAQWRAALLPVHRQMERRIGKDLIDAIARQTAEK